MCPTPAFQSSAYTESYFVKGAAATRCKKSDGRAAILVVARPVGMAWKVRPADYPYRGRSSAISRLPEKSRRSLRPGHDRWSDWPRYCATTSRVEASVVPPHHSVPPLSPRVPCCVPRSSMPRDLTRPRCVLCDQSPDPFCRARDHVTRWPPAAFCTARGNGLSQTRGHRPAAFAASDVSFDRSTSGGRQFPVEISRQVQQ